MTTDSEIRAQYLKLIRAGFFIFIIVCVLCHVTLKLAVSRSQPPVPYEEPGYPDLVVRVRVRHKIFG